MVRVRFAALLGLSLVGCSALGDDPVRRRLGPVGLSTVPTLRDSINTDLGTPPAPRAAPPPRPARPVGPVGLSTVPPLRDSINPGLDTPPATDAAPAAKVEAPAPKPAAPAPRDPSVSKTSVSSTSPGKLLGLNVARVGDVT